MSDPPTVAEIRARLVELRDLKFELLKLPVSGNIGGTSMNFGGRIAEVQAEIDTWEQMLAGAIDDGRSERPRFEA